MSVPAVVVLELFPVEVSLEEVDDGLGVLCGVAEAVGGAGGGCHVEENVVALDLCLAEEEFVRFSVDDLRPDTALVCCLFEVAGLEGGDDLPGVLEEGMLAAWQFVGEVLRHEPGDIRVGELAAEGLDDVGVEEVAYDIGLDVGGMDEIREALLVPFSAEEWHGCRTEPDPAAFVDVGVAVDGCEGEFVVLDCVYLAVKLEVVCSEVESSGDGELCVFFSVSEFLCDVEAVGAGGDGDGVACVASVVCQYLVSVLAFDDIVDRGVELDLCSSLFCLVGEGAGECAVVDGMSVF